MVALSRSDSKDLAEFSKTLVGTGPGTQGSPAASRRAHESNRLSKQGWPGERSLPFQGDLHGLLMILPQVHLRNGFLSCTSKNILNSLSSVTHSPRSPGRPDYILSRIESHPLPLSL